jgi:hypothetical protein
MADRGDEITDAHNQGQEDSANNDYNPPTSSLDWLYTEKFQEERQEEKEAYDKGWENERKNR